MLSIFSFALLIIIQIIMMNPFARNVLTQEEKVEGVFLQKSNEAIDKGELVLELVNCNSMDKLWVMVNGKRVARFLGNRVRISVCDGELIEIDSTETSKSAKVKIASFSNNLSIEKSHNVIETQKNIETIARIRVTRGVY
ncbi:MAG: hypothetical protein ACM3UU_11145 [Ignavibacteriales bacterium]